MTLLSSRRDFPAYGISVSEKALSSLESRPSHRPKIEQVGVTAEMLSEAEDAPTGGVDSVAESGTEGGCKTNV